MVYPAGVTLTDYFLATFESPSALGDSYVRLTNGMADTSSIHPAIAFRGLPRSEDDVAVRVGSCLQWQGFDSPRLQLFQSGGEPIDRIVLSDVAP